MEGVPQASLELPLFDVRELAQEGVRCLVDGLLRQFSHAIRKGLDRLRIIRCCNDLSTSKISRGELENQSAPHVNIVAGQVQSLKER